MKKLLILSGKGGTGKTTVASSLIDFCGASAFADCDVDAPNLHLVAGMTAEPETKDYFGGQKAVIDPARCVGCGACLRHCRFGAIQRTDSGRYTINEYACEGCAVCQAVCPEHAVTMTDDVAGEQQLYRDTRVFSTAKLKMGRGNSGKLVTAVKKDLTRNASDAPFAVIDGSPGVGCPVIASVTGVDLVLIVAEPTVSGIHDLKRILKTADILNVPTAVCVNKYDVSTENTAQIETFCRKQELPFLGKIPFDPAASRAVNAGLPPIRSDGPAAEALKALCSAVSARPELS